MLDLKNILGSQINKKGIAKSMEAHVVCDKFDEWAKEKFKGILSEFPPLENDVFQPDQPLAGGFQIKAVSFVNGILTIQTGSSVISQEIKLKEDEIKDEVNGILGEKVIQRLMFRAI